MSSRNRNFFIFGGGWLIGWQPVNHDVLFQVYVQEPSDPSKVHVYGAAIDGSPVTFEPTQFTVDCAEAGPGLYLLSHT